MTRTLSFLCLALWLACLFVSGGSAALASPLAAAPVKLPRSAPLSLAGRWELLADPGARLALPDVLAPANASRFRLLDGFLNRGYTREASWLHFSVTRAGAADDDWMLQLSPSMLDHVTVYVQTGDRPDTATSYREYIFGDHHPLSLRPVRHSGFVVPLNIADDRPRQVYVRVQTTSSHNVSGWLYTPEEFAYWSERQSLLNGGFFGICLVVAFVNLIYAIWLRDLLYGYYSCYVLALSASYLGVAGILPLFWPSGAHLVADYLTGWGTALSLTFFALFATRLFDTGGKPALGHRYLQFTMLLGLAGCLAVPLHCYVEVAPPIMLNGILFVLVLIWKAIDLLRKNVTAGGLFLTAFTASNIGAVLALMRLLGWAPVNLVTMYGMQIGAVLSMILMTLALTGRVHEAEEKALASSRQTEQKAVELAKEMTVRLEEKRQDLEEALATEREALQGQSRFVDMISHEYRTPLAILRANLDILEMKASPDAGLTSNLGKMRRAVGRLVEVLEVSLERERLDEAIKKAGREEIDLARFLGGVMGELREMWGGDRLLLDLGNVQGRVSGDALLLKTAFLNLAENALKFSPDCEPVTISLQREGSEAVVVVSDRGRGIRREELGKVFEKYYRGAGSSDVRGGGVGLHLVKKIIEQHGGRVHLESSSPGGTAAIVRLPLMQPRESA